MFVGPTGFAKRIQYVWLLPSIILYSFFFFPLEFSLLFLFFVVFYFILLASENWCTMKSLASLHLEDLPYLNGTLPACLGNISRLGSITIEQTGLQGEIPWSRWMPLFKDQGSILNSLGLRFSLKGNLGLYGRALPEEFPLGCLIQNFRISQQPRLSGDLPSTVSKCRMKTLYITDVSLTGELPLEIRPSAACLCLLAVCTCSGGSKSSTAGCPTNVKAPGSMPRFLMKASSKAPRMERATWTSQSSRYRLEARICP